MWWPTHEDVQYVDRRQIIGMNLDIISLYQSRPIDVTSVGKHLDKRDDSDIQWKKWERDPETKKITLNPKNTTSTTIIGEMEKDAESFSQHLFSASWQTNQYSFISKNVPKGCIGMVYNFAENYSSLGLPAKD